jgi:hypothetical protein
MKRRTSRRSWTAMGAVVTVAIVALTMGSLTASSPRGALSGAAHARDGVAKSTSAHPLKRSTIKAELTELSQANGFTTDPAKAEATLADAPGMPACAPPPVPAATYPPDNSYGIPFLAAITNGQVLAGYDQWTANHLTWTVNSGGQSTTYNLYPWQSKIYDITGWVTGLLQLPSLTADIPPQDIVFCDNDGNSNCLSADSPAGQCIHILAQYGPSPASPAPPPALGNDHPAGTSCYGYSTPTFLCFPFVVSLTPSGDTKLQVTGVESDGALDLQVTTSATTTVSEVPPPPATVVFTCEDNPTVTLSTVAPTSLPPTAPGPPNPPNTDDRSLQTTPEPLTGPLASASSTVASDDFAVPAFIPSPGGSPCSPTVADALNTYAGGWNGNYKQQSTGRYYLEGGNNPDAAEPGWAQFTATTTVVTLGLPVGPPAGFNF